MNRVQQTGARVEELLTELRSRESSAAAAEQLVGLLVGLYGDGLSRIMAVLSEKGEAGEVILGQLTEDPLVESLLLLHDLHPLSVDERVQQALDRVRPYLGSHAGGVHYLGVADGVARLRLEGSCHGCPSSSVTVKLAIEDAVREAAPEVSEIVVEGMTELPSRGGPALLQIGRRPADAGPGGPGGPAAPEPAADGGQGHWVSLPDFGPPSAHPVTTSADGVTVLVCSVRGTLYAYRDACAACGSPLGDGQLDREVLTCQCGARYNVCKAGAGIDDPALHLDPLPLLTDSQGVRVAVPAEVRS